MLNVGDRVSRAGLRRDDPRRYGTITDKYLGRRGTYAYQPQTLYAVRWDDNGLEERGYMDIGLQKETT